MPLSDQGSCRIQLNFKQLLLAVELFAFLANNTIANVDGVIAVSIALRGR